MKRLLALVLLLVAVPAAIAATKMRTYVLETGVYDKIVLDGGEVWLGVYPSGNQADVRECKLRVRRVPNEMDDGNTPATKVEATPNREPLFLLKGSPSVKPGKVRSLYTWTDEVPQTIHLNLGGKKYRLVTSEEEESDGRAVSRLRLKLDGKQMVLGDCGIRDSIYPAWAGDLDGDGRLDVYVRIEHHNFAMEQILFLSSADPTGKALTARAAKLTIRKLE